MSEINDFVKPYNGPDILLPNWVKRTVLYELRILKDGLRRPDLSRQVLYTYANNKPELSDMLNLLVANKAKKIVTNWTIEKKIVCLNQIKDEIQYWQNESRKWEQPIVEYAETVLKGLAEKLNTEEYAEVFSRFTSDLNYLFTVVLDDERLLQKLKDNVSLSRLDTVNLQRFYEKIDTIQLMFRLSDYMNFKNAAINQVRTLWPLFVTLFSQVDKVLYLDRKDNRGRPSYSFLTKIILEHTELFSNPNQNKSEVVNLVNRLIVSKGHLLSQPINHQTVSKYLIEAKKVNGTICTI
jgi:hypothetical protein